MKMKRQIALLVISALLIGLLPMGNATVSKAGQDPISAAGGTTRADYGLNNPTTDSNGVTTWDCVWFGNYWQEDTNGDGEADKNDAKQPIKWRVLSVDGDDAFLLADKNLDCQKYNDTYTSVTWETCTMRSWLNGYGGAFNKGGKDYGSNNFLNNAFLAGEQSAIRTTNIVNNDNPEYGTEGGNDTSDKVYLLSLDEVMNPVYGFSPDYSEYDESRRAKNTEYAKAQGAWTITSTEYAGNGYWWLRSPGYGSNSAASVYNYGDVDRSGDYVNYDGEAARPALHLNLSSTSSWSYAGTVTSEGGVKEEATPVPGASVQPTEPASAAPTEKPGVTPSAKPSGKPTTVPETEKPGATPTVQPSEKPTTIPETGKPNVTPATEPSEKPTMPSDTENSPIPVSPLPSIVPAEKPSTTPTAKPSANPITTPGAVTPVVSVSPLQTLTPVLQPTASPAVTSVGKVASIKLAQKKQTVTASWKKVSGAAGYQICYSTSKKWKGKKQKLLRKNKVTVKNLKRKKTYYFRVRAYRLEGSKKVYGAWSKTKRITMKK